MGWGLRDPRICRDSCKHLGFFRLPRSGWVCSRTWWGHLVRLWVLAELLRGLGDEVRHRSGKETNSLLLHEGTQGWWFWEHPSEHPWHWLKHSFMCWRWGSCKKLYGQRRWTNEMWVWEKGKAWAWWQPHRSILWIYGSLPFEDPRNNWMYFRYVWGSRVLLFCRGYY